MSTPTDTRAALTAAAIRRQFIEYFESRHGHASVPSSPVVPHGDPTLLFTNAGMNQFKDVFLGQGTRPYTRAVNSQKCIRAGGKHNDLEDVGKDLYHHTFFEMLGNWSFGDYFKAEAIEWAWDLLTNVWGIDPDRLYVSVFAGDEKDGLGPDTEAEDIWRKFIAPDRISRWGRKDNFWEMGETGPCGPCSEIHYDGRPDEARRRVPGADLVNRDHADVIEVWNLVFIQFNRARSPGDGRPGPLSPLPAKGVDTGMGLERIVRVLQHEDGNYGTDLWTPLFEAIQRESGARPYGGVLDDHVDVAYRVIADHVRCLTVAIGDGGRPSNEKAGYVLRRILRRAVRHAHQTLGVDGPLLSRIVPAVVQSLGDAFPELRKDPEHLAEIIHDEEESFLRTLDRGLALFDEAAGRAGDAKRISAEDAFRLHDTFGFPVDLTRVMAEERGMTVDEDGYEQLMTQAREVSRRGGEGAAAITLPPEAIARLRNLGIDATVDEPKYERRPISGKVQAIWNGTDFDDEAGPGRRVGVIVNRTSFYAEGGGQVGDGGTIIRAYEDAGADARRGRGARDASRDVRFRVEDTRAFGPYVLHLGQVTEERLRVSDSVVLGVDRDRRIETESNHTATHLLNLALREVVGEDQDQRGSLVAPDRLRFDFTCPHALTPEQLESIEHRVREAIESGLAVDAQLVPLEIAQTINGVRAVFGERYPDPVRVVAIGAALPEVLAAPDDPKWAKCSMEFCGGTHLASTDEARSFAVVHEQALAAGIRRIAALTGPAAMAAREAGRDLLARIDAAAGLDETKLVDEVNEIARSLDELTLSVVDRHAVAERLEPLRGRVKKTMKAAQKEARGDAVTQARALADAASGPVIVESIDGADKDALATAMDVVRARHPDAAAMLLSADAEAGKVLILATVPKSMIAGGLRAGDWAKVAASACGGGGGGRPDRASAGGRDPARVPEAIEAARAHAEKIQ